MISIGLNLPPRITYKLIETSGLTYYNRPIIVQLTYEYLINSCYNEDISLWNNRLEEIDDSIKFN